MKVESFDIELKKLNNNIDFLLKQTTKGHYLDKKSINIIRDDYKSNFFLKGSKDVKIQNSNNDNKVYVMIDHNTGFYKIGRSVSPKIRERTLQSEKPTIEMLFNFNKKKESETYLHKKYNKKRIRGEWFNLTKKDLEYIYNYLKTEENK